MALLLTACVAYSKILLFSDKETPHLFIVEIKAVNQVIHLQFFPLQFYIFLKTFILTLNVEFSFYLRCSWFVSSDPPFPFYIVARMYKTHSYSQKKKH